MACAAKGIEVGTLCTMDEVFEQVLPAQLHARSCAISGPSFAAEVARDLPTAVVVAGRDARCAHAVANAFHGSRFRVYHTDDIIGAELGGALKNVMAIACGIIDGQGLGLNARAALITRGLAEITRLAVARGANPLTLAGLAGMGDLVLTCTDNQSRNRRMGLLLAQGKSVDDATREIRQVVEGIKAAPEVLRLAKQHGVEMPITEAVGAVLDGRMNPVEAVRALATRPAKPEAG